MLQLLTFLATIGFVWLVLSGIRSGFPAVYKTLLTKLHLDAPPSV